MKPLFRLVELGDCHPSAEAVGRALETGRPAYDGVVFEAPSTPNKHDLLCHALGLARRLQYRYRQVSLHGDLDPGRLFAAGANLFLVDFPPLDEVLEPGRPRISTGTRRLLAAAARASRLAPRVAVAARLRLNDRPSDHVALRSLALLLERAGVRHLSLSHEPVHGDEALRRLIQSSALDLQPFTTVALAGKSLLHGGERERPPMAYPMDGDPYIFRTSTGSGPSVLLLHPPRYRAPLDRTLFPSLGLARLAAFIREHGYEVEQHDLDLSALRAPAVARALDASAAAHDKEAATALAALELSRLLPDELSAGVRLVGFDLTDPHEHFQVDLTLALLRRLHERHPHHTFVVGGDSAEIGKLLARTKADDVRFFEVAGGQGELFMLGLLNRLEFNDRPLSAIINRSITGETFEEPSPARIYDLPVVELGRRRLPSPDFAPRARAVAHPAPPASPPRTLAERYSRGPSPLLESFCASRGLGRLPRVATLPYQMIAGCNADCVFCNYPRRMDVRPPKAAAREMVALAERTGFREFYLLNPTLNLTSGYAHRFADELLRLGHDLLWFDSARPIGIDSALAEKLSAAGCVMLTFGIDGGSDRLLRLMRKGFLISDVEKSLQATASAGIVNRFNLMVGFPHEIPQDLDETTAFLARNATNLHILGCYNPFYLNAGIPLEKRGVAIRRREGQVRLAGSLTVPYDEVGGLAWEEKRERVTGDFKNLLDEIIALGICPRDLPEHDLLALARRAPDRQLVHEFVRFIAHEHGTR